MTTHRSTMILNTSPWAMPVFHKLRHLEGHSNHFAQDVIITFFGVINQLIQDRHVDLTNRADAVEFIVAIVVSELEGSYDEPREYEGEEMDAIIEVVSYLYDDLLTSVHGACFTADARFDYTRLVGHDVVCNYSSHRHALALPPPAQVASVYRTRNAYDDDSDLPRFWI